MSVLSVVNLKAKIGGRLVVDDASFEIEEGDVFFLLGPNGSGKSTLLKAIVGYPGVEVVSGRVLYEGVDITGMPMEERVARGITLAHQIPPKLVGVKLGGLLRTLCKKNECDHEELVNEMEINHLVNRDFGKGFSGGELKRAEIALLLAQRPKLPLIDEPDSGVDVDSIAVIARGVKRLIESSPHKAAIIVTHSALIARYVPPTKVCVMIKGSIRLCGGREIVEEVFSHGFKELA
ncbi:MAG: ATP-binding cassette domain-containing protein [Desulfurococcaceae archaeon]